MSGLAAADFDYDLPPERIAQRPLKNREDSRLLVLHRSKGEIEDSLFRRLPQYFSPGDAVVVNDCWVMPARIRGRKDTGGHIELTLLTQSRSDDQVWECLVRASRTPQPGTRVRLGDRIRAEFLEEKPMDISIGSDREGGRWLIRLLEGDLLEVLQEEGRPPLPPYIKRREADDPAEDRSRYQTVYAAEGRAAAAPTAGLHFGEAMLGRLREMRVEMAKVTLEVGLGTFAPVRVENIESHRMHPERYRVSGEAADKINRAGAAGHRCVAVGTTVVRTLEHMADDGGSVIPGTGETDLFIYPGYRFKVVDVLLTNFHLPRSTLLMLVSAFAGREFVLKAYAHAVKSGYRFLSYGDAMLIL